MKADFVYDYAAGVYRCPAREALIYRATTEQQGPQMRRYWTEACTRREIKIRADRVRGRGVGSG